MIINFSILAQQTEREPGWGALLYFAIFILIWIISAIVNVLNKRHQRRRAEMEDEEWEPVDIEEPMRREAPPVPVPQRMPERAPQRPVERRIERPPVVVERRPPPRIEPAPPPLPRAEMPRPQRQVRQAPTPRREFPAGATARQPDRRFPTAPRRVPVTEMPPAPSADVLRRTEIGAGARQQQAGPSKTTTGDAPAIARLLQPTALQQNFILTEILQPPKGMRPPE